MRRIVGIVSIGLALATASGSARGQAVGPYRPLSYYSAPGTYGTSWGYSSYGLRQTYTTFASPYGPGYAYGYAPAALLPGPYGAGLWARGVPQPLGWRTPYYGTFAVPAVPPPVILPPIGVYAPAFGPGIPPRVWGYGY